MTIKLIAFAGGMSAFCIDLLEVPGFRLQAFRLAAPSPTCGFPVWRPPQGA
jgi:hypothetical protein